MALTITLVALIATMHLANAGSAVDVASVDIPAVDVARGDAINIATIIASDTRHCSATVIAHNTAAMFTGVGARCSSRMPSFSFAVVPYSADIQAKFEKSTRCKVEPGSVIYPYCWIYTVPLTSHVQEDPMAGPQTVFLNISDWRRR